MPGDQPETEQGGAGRKPSRRRLFGRSKGKALRAAQAGRFETLLPQLSVDLARLHADPFALFARRPAALHLEIGFGGGEHLASQARSHPDIGFFGAEPFLNGVAKLLAEIETGGLDNIRIHHGDARELLAALPAASLERVDLLYPDPWPKRRQRKRRIVDEAFLTEVARVLVPGGEFRFATDIDDYAGWVLARIAAQEGLVWLAETADDWREAWPGWQRTRYEAKAIREGRVPGYFRFRKRTSKPA